MHRRTSLLSGLSALVVLGVAGQSWGDEGKLRITGYVQNQTGVFISRDKTSFETFDAYPYPTNHGDKFGKLSMLRNTLLLDADYRPLFWLRFKAVFRGVFGPPLSADAEAQTPNVPGGTKWAQKREDYVAEHFYNRAELREVYVDLRPHRYVLVRLGRQLVGWGETGQYRLLDVVNPVDSTWHFGALESFEDQRIPLFVLRMVVDVPKAHGGVDIVYVPMVPFLDRSEDTVSVPLTLVGAWGLPISPRQGDASVSSSKIRNRVFEYPDQKLQNGRAGARWFGEIGPLTYSLIYFYGHQLSPPIPKYYVTGDFRGVDVTLDFPRQHQFGFSLQGVLPFPASTMLRAEMLFEPDRTYPCYSELKKPYKPPTPEDPTNIAQFLRKEKFTINYAITIQQPLKVKFLNPREVFVLALQFYHSFIPTLKASSLERCASNEGDCILEVPGFDSTLMRKHHFRLGGSLQTSYLRGMITPKFSFAWVFAENGFKEDFKDGGALISVGLDFALKNFKVGVALNEFLGKDPYYGMGFFRDRDEVNIKVRYQF